MGDVRVVGRAGGGRCVVCHDAADAGVVRCPGCLAQWHPDCAPTSGRCPTIGCATPVAEAASTLARSGPSLARAGQFGRLLARHLVALFFMAAFAVALTAVVLDSATTLRGALFTGGSGPPLPLVLAFGTFVVALIGGLVAVPVSGLVGLWRQLREARRLLDQAAPVPMRLTTSWAPSPGDWPAELRIVLEGAGQRFDLTVRAGALPPWLATPQVDRPALVRGLAPPRPFLLEDASGDLALVQP